MTPHFIDDEKLRARFWGAAGDLCIAAGLKRSESNATAHAALHVDSVRDWGGDPEADAPANLTAALKVVATYLIVNHPENQSKIENVARAFETPRLGAVGARRIGGDMTPDEIKAKLDESRKKPLFSIPVADARAANGLAPEQPLTDVAGTGREFVANARAWAERQAQAVPVPSPEPQPAPVPASDAASIPAPLRGITTLAGVPVTAIAAHMNRRFPAKAYKEIPYGPMRGKSDIAGDFVRDRFDEVFGPHGLGWQLVPHPALGKTEHIEVEDKRKDGSLYTVHMVALENWIVRYRIVRPDGVWEWAETGPVSDCDDNEDRGYAYRGAWTALLKQALRLFGGLNHVYREEYTHVHAGQELRAQKHKQTA